MMRIINKSSLTKRVMAGAFLTLATLGTCNLAAAATITWKGYVWDVTGAEPIGAPSDGQINGNENNVTIDGNGYLHVKITKSGNTYTGAQLFTQKNLGFGTYQFQVQGDITNMDKGVVFGLFPYGPTAGIGKDGENEIDIEFSKWNDTSTGNNADFTYYPPTGFGTADYQSSFEHNFFINFGGATLSTSRIEWTSTSINSIIMTGLQPIGTTANVVSPNDYYAPSSPKTKIPQTALPVGINLWTYGSKPTKELDIIIRDFVFVPQCTSNCSSSSKSSVKSSSSSSSSSGSFTKLIQAESFTNMSGVQLETTSDTDGGQNVGWIDAGDWMAYANVNFPTTGTYKIESRVASLSGGGILSLDLNAGATQLGQISVPSTGGWQNWTTISQTVTVNAGTYALGIYAAQGGWNINWIKITKL